MKIRGSRIGLPGRSAVALAVVTAVGLAAAGAACEDRAAPPEPVHFAWKERFLPAGGGQERIALRAGAVCGARWYLTGALVAADGGTRPAAWTSADGLSWSAMRLAPAPDSYYGRRSVLYSAACRDGRLGAIGDKPGGAHGNPRTSTWYQPPGPAGADGGLTEVVAAFETYGGPKAVNVARLAAGPAGWLIAGNRSSGAAVWYSADAAEFRIIEGAPGLASEPGLITWANDAVAHAGGWTLVGGVIRAGHSDRDASAWTSTDALTWRRQGVGGTAEYDEMIRVIEDAGGLLAVGLDGATFRAWRLTADGWHMAGRFGSAIPKVSTGPRTGPTAPGLTRAGGLVVAVVSDGATYRLFSTADGGDTWREVPPPIALPAGAGAAVTVVGTPDRLLLVADDGRVARIFLADTDR